MQKNIRRQLGVTMIELMFGLAIAAGVVVGGVTAYNAVEPRMTANNLFAAMQGFMVDVAQYLEVYHQETPGGIPEASFSGGTSGAKTLGGATAADNTLPVYSWTCTTTNPCPDGSTTGTQNAPNPNLQRFTSMPSIRHGQGTYDDDGEAEWHIATGSGGGIDIGFSILPAAAFAQDFGFGTLNATYFPGCTSVTDATRPDTAVAVVMPVRDLAVCDNLSTSVERLDHVGGASCFDSETNPAFDGDWGGNLVVGEALMTICFLVQ